MDKKMTRAARRRKQRNRRILMTIALMMLVAVVSIGGTIAWLTDYTTPVTNTFTGSNIDIELDESDDLDLQMVPGFTITKDPKVTVKANSEDCWLFVKIEKSSTLDTYIEYSVITGENGWTALAGVDGVYYRKVMSNTADQDFYVLSGANNGTVTVKSTVTKALMDALNADGAVQPTLTFTAYAAQLYETNGTEFSVSEAWNLVKPAGN